MRLSFVVAFLLQSGLVTYTETGAQETIQTRLRTGGTHTLDGNGMSVTSLAFTPSGNRVVVAAGKSARVWSFATGETTPLDGHQGQVTCVAVSPNGKLILSGCWDRTVRIWDAANGAEVLKIGEAAGPNVAAKFVCF